MYLPCRSGTTVPCLRTSDSYLSQPQTGRHPPVRPLRPQRITNLSRNRITLVDHAVISHAPLPTTGYRRRQVGSYRPLPSRSLLSLVLISSPVLRALSPPGQANQERRPHPLHLIFVYTHPFTSYPDRLAYASLPISTANIHSPCPRLRTLLTSYAHSQPRP